MGHLEDELARLRMEVEALGTERTAATAAERQRHLKVIVGAIRRGDDLDEFDPAEVELVRDALTQYGVAAQQVIDRLTASGGTLGEDGGLRLVD